MSAQDVWARMARFFRPTPPRVAQPGPPAEPKGPPGQLVYAVGDIHGESGLLADLLARIGEDAATAGGGRPVTVIFLGDYVDRGPDSRGVVELLCGDPLPGARLKFLRGNHEQAMLDFLADPAAAADWLAFGGTETLASYGVPASAGRGPGRAQALAEALAERLPDHHLDFLQGTQLMAVAGDFAFVHAGIRPDLPLNQQKPQDLLWVRAGFVDREVASSHVIVHGHTIVDEPTVGGGKVAIDTGAYATGTLTALAIDGPALRFLRASRG